jgi:hypothetical protein
MAMPGRTAVTVEFESEKLKALRFYAGKKEAEIETELVRCLGRLYEKYVPAQTREYIESDPEAGTPPVRPRRAAGPASNV